MPRGEDLQLLTLQVYQSNKQPKLTYLCFDSRACEPTGLRPAAQFLKRARMRRQPAGG